MPAALYPKRWWDLCVPEDNKKMINLFFVDGKLLVLFHPK